jgi:hypothetical protein
LLRLSFATCLLVHHTTDPTPFFKAISKKPYRSQIILAPRIFSTTPNSNSSSNGSSSGGGGGRQTLRPHSPPVPAGHQSDQHKAQGPVPIKVLDNSFQQLSQVGFCVAEGSCFKFPVAVIQQVLGPAAAQQQQQGGQSGEPDLQMFADFVLRTQAHQREAPEDAVTGSWYQWDLLGGTAEGPHGTAGETD